MLTLSNIRYIENDLVSPKSEKIDIILHQCNCGGKMGAGLARQIARKYPEVAKLEQNFCSVPRSAFAKNCIVTTHDGRVVVNMHSQFRYGTEKRQTNYKALETCLRLLSTYYFSSQSPDLVIGIPYNLGCGLAGGDWNVVLPIIEQFASKVKQTVVIVKYKKY